MLPPGALGLAATTALLVQGQFAQGPGLVVELRDPSGQPVGGARGYVVCDPAHELPALRHLPAGHRDLARVLPQADRLDGTSDARGLLRFRRDGVDPTGRSGAGLAFTAAGLGVLVPRLQPGRAMRLPMAPMGVVSTPGGSERFQLFARADLGNGETIALLPQPGPQVRLPAGSYEVWAHSDDGWCWQRLDLVSGQRADLRFDGPGQRIARGASTYVFPAGRPEVDLFAGAAETTLRGAALAAPLCALEGGWLLGPQVLPGPPSAEPRRWPLAGVLPERVKLDAGAAPAGTAAALFTLARTEGDAWRLVHVSAMGEERSDAGAFHVPAEPVGDCWLLLVAGDHAPKAVPWLRRDRPGALALERGVPLVVHARDEQGLPVADLCVDYAPDGMEPATVEARSDARGTARLGPVLGPGRLRVSDPRFHNQDLPLADIPRDGVQLAIAAGASLRGRAVWPDGTPAAGVVVTLRDPGGRLRPGQRTVASGQDGGFVFTGLPEDLDLVLFASQKRDGRTWSARLGRQRAGGEAVELVVRDEDPQLGPPGGR